MIDGPFDETRELVAGYWVWEVKSMDDAVAWAKKIPSDGSDGDIDIRPIMEMEDFGQEFSPALRQQEERLRSEMDARKR